MHTWLGWGGTGCKPGEEGRGAILLLWAVQQNIISKANNSMMWLAILMRVFDYMQILRIKIYNKKHKSIHYRYIVFIHQHWDSIADINVKQCWLLPKPTFSKSISWKEIELVRHASRSLLLSPEIRRYLRIFHWGKGRTHIFWP